MNMQEIGVAVTVARQGFPLPEIDASLRCLRNAEQLIQGAVGESISPEAQELVTAVGMAILFGEEVQLHLRQADTELDAFMAATGLQCAMPDSAPLPLNAVGGTGAEADRLFSLRDYGVLSTLVRLHAALLRNAGIDPYEGGAISAEDGLPDDPEPSAVDLADGRDLHAQREDALFKIARIVADPAALERFAPDDPRRALLQYMVDAADRLTYVQFVALLQSMQTQEITIRLPKHGGVQVVHVETVPGDPVQLSGEASRLIGVSEPDEPVRPAADHTAPVVPPRRERPVAGSAAEYKDRMVTRFTDDAVRFGMSLVQRSYDVDGDARLSAAKWGNVLRDDRLADALALAIENGLIQADVRTEPRYSLRDVVTALLSLNSDTLRVLRAWPDAANQAMEQMHGQVTAFAAARRARLDRRRPS